MKRLSVQILTALMAIMILGAIWFFFRSHSEPEPFSLSLTNQQTSPSVASTVKPLPRPEPVSSAPASPTPSNYTPGPAQPILRRLLNQDTENPLRAEEVRDLVENIKSLGQAALPDIQTLLTNSAVSDRVLGLHLMLEVGGVSDQVLQWAASDNTSFVPAQAAAWLYQNGQFKEYENFLAQNATNLDAIKMDSLMKSLENKPPRLPEATLATTSLGLGQSLPGYAEEILRRNKAALEQVHQTMIDSTASPVLKDNLFDLLHNANPTGYENILKEFLVSNNANNAPSPLREKILWHLQNESVNGQMAAFLRQLPPATPAESERLATIANTIEQRSNAQFSMVQNLQDAVKDLMQQSNPQQAQATPALLDKFVELAKRDPNFMPKVEILAAAKDLYVNSPPPPTVSESAWRQKQADVDYLLWRVKQSQPQ